MSKSLLRLLVMSCALAASSLSASTSYASQSEMADLAAQLATVRIIGIDGRYNVNHAAVINVSPGQPIMLSADLLTSAGQPTRDSQTDFVWRSSVSPNDVCDAAVPAVCANRTDFRVNQYGVVFTTPYEMSSSIVITVYSHNPAAVRPDGAPSVDTLILNDIGSPQPIEPPPPVRHWPVDPVPIHPRPPIRPPIIVHPPIHPWPPRPPIIVHPPYHPRPWPRPPIIVHPPRRPWPPRPPIIIVHPPVRPPFRPLPPVRPPFRPRPPVVVRPPVYHPPVYHPPVYRPPVYRPPVVVRPPVYHPPVYRPPVYRPPVYHPPVYHPPVYHPPVYRPPVNRPPQPRPQPRPIRRR